MVDSFNAINTVGRASLWVGFLAMVATAVGIYVRALFLPSKSRLFSAVSFGICAFAATAYLTMAAGEGMSVEKVNGAERQIYWGRYFDWMLTTPLLLIDLGLLAGIARVDIFMACVWDEVMILTGVAGALNSSQLKWPLWIFGCVAMLFIFQILLGGVRIASAKKSELASGRYKTLMALTLALWTVYPVIWALGEGLGKIPVDVEVTAYAVLDVIAKCFFSILLLAARPDEEESSNLTEPLNA